MYCVYFCGVNFVVAQMMMMRCRHFCGRTDAMGCVKTQSFLRTYIDLILSGLDEGRRNDGHLRRVIVC